MTRGWDENGLSLVCAWCDASPFATRDDLQHHINGAHPSAGSGRPGDPSLGLIAVDALRVGDRILYSGAPCTILRDFEPCKDLFGREMHRYWSQRHDTDAEGWLMFGPGAVVHEDPEHRPLRLRTSL